MEILRSAVKLLLIILLIAIGSKVIYKNNFVVIDGQLIAGKAEINYPDGLNKNNCVVISYSLDNSGLTKRQWAYGNVFDSSSYIGGAVPYKIEMDSNLIKITTKNIQLRNNESPAVSDSKVDFNYRLVLMKI